MVTPHVSFVENDTTSDSSRGRTNEREFAFGTNEHGGCGCPAVEAGFPPEVNEWLRETIVEYDALVRNDTDKPSGTVSEDVAREKWNKAVEEMKNVYGRRSAAFKKGHKWPTYWDGNRKENAVSFVGTNTTNTGARPVVDQPDAPNGWHWGMGSVADDYATYWLYTNAVLYQDGEFGWECHVYWDNGHSWTVQFIPYSKWVPSGDNEYGDPCYTKQFDNPDDAFEYAVEKAQSLRGLSHNPPQ